MATPLGAATPAFTESHAGWPDPRFTVGPLLYQDNFHGTTLENWTPQMQAGGTVSEAQGHLIINVPAGCTVWFRHQLSGPVLIEYQATVIGKGGPNDRVSDLNCFWMAQDPRHPNALLQYPRDGKFSDYDTLNTYYVGQGGNSNTTTRFRRYVGATGERPLLPQNDLRDPSDLLRPNVPVTVRLVADGSLIQYYCSDRRLFEMNDPQPYTQGWFGLRTVDNHMEIRQFRVYRLLPPQNLKKQAMHHHRNVETV